MHRLIHRLAKSRIDNFVRLDHRKLALERQLLARAGNETRPLNCASETKVPTGEQSTAAGNLSALLQRLLGTFLHNGVNPGFEVREFRSTNIAFL